MNCTDGVSKNQNFKSKIMWRMVFRIFLTQYVRILQKARLFVAKNEIDYEKAFDFSLSMEHTLIFTVATIKLSLLNTHKSICMQNVTFIYLYRSRRTMSIPWKTNRPILHLIHHLDYEAEQMSLRQGNRLVFSITRLKYAYT